MSDYKYVRVDLLKKEIKKNCKSCSYYNSEKCLSCEVPAFEALVDVVYERQEHDKRIIKEYMRGEREHE